MALRRASTTALALALLAGGCLRDRDGQGPCPGPATRCGDLVPAPAEPTCPGVARCDVDWSVVDGARLHARWLDDDDGQRWFAGLEDTALGQACVFRELEGRARCVPLPRPPAEGMDHGRYFADPSCSVALVGPEAAQGPVTLGTGERFGPPLTVVRAGEPFVGRPFIGFWWLEMQGGGGGGVWRFTCLLASDAVPSLVHAIGVPASELVGASPAYASRGDGRLAPAILAADDGLELPVAVAASPAPGGAWPTLQAAFDRARGEPCTQVLDRCLPLDTARCGNASCEQAYPRCTDDDGAVVGTGDGPRYGEAPCPGLPGVASVTTVVGYACSSAQSGTVDYLPPSTFAPLQRATIGAARLRLTATTDGAGYCQPSGGFHDTRLAVDCTVTETAMVTRCVPDDLDAVGYVQDVWSDDACATPLRLITCFGACRWARSFAGDAYHDVGAADTAPFFVRLGDGSCVESSTETWYHLGPRAEPSFAGFTGP